MAKSRQALVEWLFVSRGRALRDFLRRRLRTQQEAEELAQEVYLRMLQVKDEIRDPEAYLFTVARNLVREHAVLQSRARSALSIDDPKVEADSAEIPDFGRQLDAERRKERLQQVLRELSPKCRAAVVLQLWHGMSYEEIARQLGVSTHMVKKYLSQALVLCRRRMARLG